MRSNPADYQFVAPGSLQAVISLLGEEPGAWLPIAGGTDVMVQYAAGKLPARKLVSIWNLPELQHIEVSADEIRIGAGCTYTDLRKHDIVQREFSLLARAAAWTGGIANQNRGTLGGNIVNASPAAGFSCPRSGIRGGTHSRVRSRRTPAVLQGLPYRLQEDQIRTRRIDSIDLPDSAIFGTSCIYPQSRSA